MRNVPNLLSISRLLATVLVFIFILVNQPWAYIIGTVLFVLASVTDYLDGYIARKYKVVSSLGVFLDLTADKVFVAAILIAFVQTGLVPAWITCIVVTREFVVSGLRSIAATKGRVIPAGVWGKQKTFITLVALGLLLLAKALGASGLSLFPWMLTFTSQTVTFPNILFLIADIGLILATIWTIFSGIEYLVGGWSLLISAEQEK